MTERAVDFPFFGISTTLTLHVPVRVPRTAEPANAHRVAPLVMLMRMRPCEPRGIDMPTALARRAALSVLPRRTVNVTFCAACAAVFSCTDVVTLAAVVVVAAALTLGAPVVVVVVDVEVLTLVVETAVVGGSVVGASVLVVVDVVVVVVVAGRPETVAGVSRFNRSDCPAWPVSFRPQHVTSPVSSSAHVWCRPAAMSTTPVDNPVTPAGVGRLVPETPLPTAP